MKLIRWRMPVLARHEGEWKGVYSYVDTDGKELDRHESHLICRFPEDGAWDYHQTNRYSWADGRSEEHVFPATYAEGRIWWDTERIEGCAWEIDSRTVCLTWARKDLPGEYLYEMIQISQDGNKRGRTWHWFRDDEMYMRTLIKERRVK
ncbi:MAG: DUF3598 domain-containing protein [Oceanicaulis sp.]